MLKRDPMRAKGLCGDRIRSKLYNDGTPEDKEKVAMFRNKTEYLVGA